MKHTITLDVDLNGDSGVAILELLKKVNELKLKGDRHKIGNRYHSAGYGYDYILAQAEYMYVVLINLTTGQRFNDKVYVNNPSALTQKEWDKLTDGNEFTKI